MALRVQRPGEAPPATAAKDPDFGSTITQRHPRLGNLVPRHQVWYWVGLRVGVLESHSATHISAVPHQAAG